MFKTYYHLTKPGIIYGNAITAIAGFLLASKGRIDPKLLLAMIVGLSLVIASGCVFNNVTDKDIDGNMDRTKNRAMVTGKISQTKAIIFGVVLILVGIFILHFHTNNSALLAAMVGFIVYVFLYTPLKRKTSLATIIGSIAGATPPVVGYAAVTNKFDAGAIILFFILVFWQMPHFYAIAIYRLKDYASARIPVLPITSGIKVTKIHILFYIAAFIITSSLLTFYRFTGYSFLTLTTILGLVWLTMGIKGFKNPDDAKWARKMFLFSLIILTTLSIVLSFGKMLI